MTKGRAWYVIKTNPQCEKKATAELRRIGIRVYQPKSRMETRNRRTREVTPRYRPLLVGYLLIHFTNEPDWFNVRQCQGVKGVLYADGRPGEIPAAAVAALMRRQRAAEFDNSERGAIRRGELENVANARMKARYRRGNIMRVISGPFESFLVSIDKLFENGDVAAKTSIFGRETVIRFDSPEEYLLPLEIVGEAA